MLKVCCSQRVLVNRFQPLLDGFDPSLDNEVSVGGEVLYNNPIVRSFTNQNCNGIRVRLSFTLQHNKISNHQVVQVQKGAMRFQIWIQDSDAFLCRADITITGKFTSPFEKIWYFPVNPSNTATNFAVKLVRLTPTDVPDAYGLTNDNHTLNWISYASVTHIQAKFKRIAYVGIKFDTETFGTNYPERKFRLGGIKADIPTNASVNANDQGLDFVGNWDGTMKDENTWSARDFFAIIWYLLTDTIDGLGNYIDPSQIDRYSLYNISAYNNQYIPDGLGGQERRYLFNLVLNQVQDGWKAIDAICSACNVTRFWDGVTLTFMQDRPQVPLANISNADVINGEFVYSTTDLDDRATAIHVSWMDLNDFMKVKTVYVYDAQLVAKYGYRVKQIEAVGCVRQSQAIRLGRAVVYSENYETETVTFQARGYAAYLTIGTLINIADIDRNTYRIGGLLIAATPPTGSNQATVTLDQPVNIGTPTGYDDRFYTTYYPDIRAAIATGVITSGYAHWVATGQSEGRRGNGYLLYCMLPNLSTEFQLVTNPPGLANVLTLQNGFSVTPTLDSTWILFAPDQKPQLFRVMGKEIDNDNPDLVTITATQYSEYKWEYVERNLVIKPQPVYVQYNSTLNPPTNLLTSKIIQRIGSLNVFQIKIDWTAAARQTGYYDPYLRKTRGYYSYSNDINSNFQQLELIRYELSYSTNGGDYQNTVQVLGNSFTLNNIAQGVYVFRLRAVNDFNQTSNFVYSAAITVFFNQTIARFNISSNSFFADGL